MYGYTISIFTKMSGGFFESLGYSSFQRLLLFCMICIWVRFAIAYFIYRFHTNPYVKICIGCVALLACIMNITLLCDPLSSQVWWCREIHLLNAGLMCSAILLGYSSLCAPIMVFDTLVGIMTAIVLHGYAIRGCPFS